MKSILDEIVARKILEIAAAKRRVSEQELEFQIAGLAPTRDFTTALRRPGEVTVIAEVKKASPSAGVIRADFDAVAIAKLYAANGAACLSVLTDEHFFQGRLENLTAIAPAVGVPLLRKDFVLERYQLLEARAAGADAVLLIAEILPGAMLAELHQEALKLGLHVLIELHDAEQLDRVLMLNPALVGINNRNLRTFETRLDHTLELMTQISKEATVISESGIRTRADLDRLAAAGVSGVLVGESLMRVADIGLALRTLRGLA